MHSYKNTLETCNRLHKLFIKYKYCDYEEFLKNVASEANATYSFRQLQQYAKYAKDDVHGNIKIGFEMTIILNYVLAKKREDEKLIQKFQTEVDRIKEPTQTLIVDKLIERTKKVAMQKSEKALKQNAKYIKAYLDGEIKLEDCPISIHGYLSEHIDYYGIDTYVDYIIKVNEFKPTTIDELNKLYELLDYFIYYLKQNLSFINSMDIDDPSDMQKLRNIHVFSEKYLASYMFNNNSKLRTWKKTIIENELAYYEELLRIVDTMINERNFSSIDKIDEKVERRYSDSMKRYFAHQKQDKNAPTHEIIEKTLLDYYRQIKRCIKVSNSINYHKISDKNIKEITERLSKRLILENNN